MINGALPAAVAGMLAATSVVAYVIGWMDGPIVPGIAAACGLLVALILHRHLRSTAGNRSRWPWALVVGVTLALLLWPAWPSLLPPGGASDLTHHLLLVDVLERTRHLAEGGPSEAAMGEMAHYTPGLHLLIVIAGSLLAVDAYRAAYPLLALTVALKAGVVFLIAHDALAATRARRPLAIAATGLVLFAPRAYAVDGFLQAGFLAQVASELFVVAGWWALARWWEDRSLAWMAVAGLMGAATFLAWPIWIGPLLLTAALAVLLADRLGWRDRLRAGALIGVPVSAIAVMHLWQHAAWLRIAGTGGAVPAFVPGAITWVLIALALMGAVGAVRDATTRVTLWFAGGIALQALALYLLARARGAGTPYMAMKMIYLAVYPAAVMGAAGLAWYTHRWRGVAWPWVIALVVCSVGLRQASASRVPPPIVDVDLDSAGRWARANLPSGCVDYIVDNAEQAYWLHLAVMGQPRSSARTADLDGYTTNRALGRSIAGSALPYAVARRALLPGEVVRDARVLHESGSAVVIERPGVACPLPRAD